MLTPAELHLIKILIEKVQLKVKNNTETLDPFITATGVPQDGCLSPILFILYLSKSILNHEGHKEDHLYTKPPSENPDEAILTPELIDLTYC